MPRWMTPGLCAPGCSAKILRRVVRAAVLDADPGDLSGAENPEAVEQIRLLVKEQP